MRLSEQARRVLGALAQTPNGHLLVQSVLKCVRAPATSLPVAQASLSRSLRRLWSAGFVELAMRDGDTLTAKASTRREVLAFVQGSPERAYQAYRQRLAQSNGNTRDAFGSPAAYVAYFRARARQIPHARIHVVRLTPNGRARAACHKSCSNG
jgi:DNA-binding MarR family transcriptional regulator